MNILKLHIIHNNLKLIERNKNCQNSNKSHVVFAQVLVSTNKETHGVGVEDLLDLNM